MAGQTKRGKNEGGKEKSSIYRASTSELQYELTLLSCCRGVSLHTATQKFRANIKIKGTKIALGAYFSEVEAAKAFDRAAIKYRGSRAEVNFPEDCGSGVQTGTAPAPKRKKKVKRAVKEEEDDEDFEEMTSPSSVRLATGERTSKRIKYQKVKQEEEEEEAEERQEVMEPANAVDDFLNMSDAQLMDVLDSVDGALPNLLSDFDDFTANSTPFAQKKADSGRSDVSSDDDAQVNKAFFASTSDADYPTARSDSDAPDEEHDLRSHALNILASRGLLLPARYRQQRPSIRAMHTPVQLKMRAPPQQRPLNYRQLLVARAMMSAAEADMESDSDIEPVTFSDSPTPASKDMWWRTQLHLIQQEERVQQLDRQWSVYHQYGASDLVAPMWQRTFTRKY